MKKNKDKTWMRSALHDLLWVSWKHFTKRGGHYSYSCYVMSPVQRIGHHAIPWDIQWEIPSRHTLSIYMCMRIGWLF